MPRRMRVEKRKMVAEPFLYPDQILLCRGERPFGPPPVACADGFAARWLAFGGPVMAMWAADVPPEDVAEDLLSPAVAPWAWTHVGPPAGWDVERVVAAAGTDLTDDVDDGLYPFGDDDRGDR